MVRSVTSTAHSWYQLVLIRVIIPMVNHHDQKRIGEEKVCLPYTSTSLTLKEVRTEIQSGQEPEARGYTEAMVVRWVLLLVCFPRAYSAFIL